MYYKLNEKDLKKIKDIEEITLTDYEISENLIPVDNFISIIYDLKNELEVAEEKYEDLKKDLEDNYKPISASEMYDISDRDFI